MNERISIDPRICHGKPVIRGTRVPVARVIGYLAGGMSLDDTQKDFDLTPEDVPHGSGLRGGVGQSGTTPSPSGVTSHYAISDRRRLAAPDCGPRTKFGP